MPQTLYFMSPIRYVPGHRLGSYDLNFEQMEARKKYDVTIDSHSPYSQIKRRKSIIAFYSPHECIYHAQQTYNTKIFLDFHLYKVVTDNYHQAPFSILELLYQHYSESPLFHKLIEEYWSPSSNWVLFEFLCEYAFIISRHNVNSNQDELDAILFSHQSDLQSAKKMFSIAM